MKTDSPAQYLTIDGAGDPNTATSYRQSVETLYSVAYGIKFFSKKELNRDYTVMPLQALWWAQDMRTFHTPDKNSWQWTLLNLIPDWINQDHYQSVLGQIMAKKNPPLLGQLRLETFAEGTVAQTLHVGAYDAEGPTIIRQPVTAEQP